MKTSTGTLTLMVCVLFGQACAQPSGALNLAGPVWEWRQTQMANDDRHVPGDPRDYTVRFLPASFAL